MEVRVRVKNRDRVRVKEVAMRPRVISEFWFMYFLFAESLSKTTCVWKPRDFATACETNAEETEIFYAVNIVPLLHKLLNPGEF